MALTYSSTPVRVSNGARYLLVQPVTLDSSYPSGGYPLDLTFKGQTPDAQIDAVAVAGVATPQTPVTVFFQFNATTGCLQAFGGGALTLSDISSFGNVSPYNIGEQLWEIPASTNLAGYTVNLLILGR